MQINDPEYYLSAVALFVSISSAYYAKKQSDLSKIALQNDYKAHLSNKHDKYQTALKQVNDRHKGKARHAK